MHFSFMVASCFLAGSLLFHDHASATPTKALLSRSATNNQKVLTRPEIAATTTVKTQFQLTYGDEKFNIARLKVTLTYTIAQVTKSVSSLTDQNGESSFTVDNWPTTGANVPYSFSAHLDGTESGLSFKFVATGLDTNHPKYSIIDIKQSFALPSIPAITSWDKLSDHDRRALLAYLTLQRLEPQLDSVFKLTPEKLDIYYPHGDTNYAAEFGVDGTPFLLLGLGGFPMILAHEFGHYFTYLAQKKFISYEAGVHTSCGDKKQEAKAAFGEGFANAYALIMTGKTDGKFNEGHEVIEYEHYTCSSSMTMSNDEGRFTAALFDLWDEQDDSSGGDLENGRSGFADSNKLCTLTPKEILLDPIVHALNNGKYIESPEKYWEHLKAVLTDDNKRKKASDIFLYNYADFDM